MSHEIRTPINAIIGYSDLLSMEIPGPLTDEQARQVQRVRMSAEHLSTLVDEVLDLSRIEAGQLRLENRTCAVGEVVEAAIAVVTPAAEQKGLDLVLAGESDGAGFAGDPHRVRQILINLLSNAVKFTPEGGSIEIRSAIEPSARGEDEIVIHVTDTGCGIAPHQVEAIFEPFVQGDAGYTRAHGGVGLGLSISRRLARMMGGEIEVDSELGRGSTFTVRLRLSSVAEPAI
jgi:signal transduction histidine kinase